MDPYIVRSVYYHRFIANKETRIKYLSKFPTRKYTTFKNSMMAILPVDVIRYIMYIMIDTDKIDLRLLMTESIYFYFGVKNLSIQFPSCHLTYEEMHEAMIVKLFDIILTDHRLSVDRYHHCNVCKTISNFIIKDVQLCHLCLHRLKYNVSELIFNEKLININDNDIKELKSITYYKYLKYDGELHYMSKSVQMEQKIKKLHLRSLIDKEEKMQHHYRTMLIDHIDFIYNLSYPFYNLHRKELCYNESYFNEDNTLNKLEELNHLYQHNKKLTLYLKTKLDETIKIEKKMKSNVKKKYIKKREFINFKNEKTMKPKIY